MATQEYQGMSVKSHKIRYWHFLSLQFM